MVKRVIIAVLVLPVADIAAFIVVAAIIGPVWALALMLATTLTGFLVLRRAGRGRIAHFRVAVADTDVTGFEANTVGFLTVLAGILLFVPGFLTDLIGIALLIAPVRRWCGAKFQLWVRSRGHGDRSVVDLAPGEWQQVPDRKLPNKAQKSDRD